MNFSPSTTVTTHHITNLCLSPSSPHLSFHCTYRTYFLTETVISTHYFIHCLEIFQLTSVIVHNASPCATLYQALSEISANTVAAHI
mmetsp:Transcript_6908/g.25764  ORF Transcript_6908/g.25764 Transcript_6908/m.25764 type:complete len:87 (-) Transcript_6908:518-778(-)